MISPQPVLLLDAILNDFEHAFAGTHRHEAGGGVHAGERDLLNLERDDVASAREVGGFAAVVPTGLDAAVDDEARGTGGVGVEHEDAIAHAARGHRGEAAELTAAEDSNGRARQQRWAGGV